MIALRQIQTIENDSITIRLPAEFRKYQRAEVIILSFEKEDIVDKQDLMATFLNNLPDNSEGLSRSAIEQYVQQERDDWDE